MAQKVTDPELLRILNGGGAGPVFGPPPSRRQITADARADRSENRADANAARAAANEAARIRLAQAQEERQAREFAATHDANGRPLATAETTARPTPNMLASVRAEARQKIGKLDSLIDRSKNNFAATGFGVNGITPFIDGGWPSRTTPGTNAYNQQADVETVSSAGALTKVMEMAAANGGKNPLTPLSEGDFANIAKSVTNLDIGQSDSQFQKNAGEYRDIYTRALRGAGGFDATKLRPEDADKALEDGYRGLIQQMQGKTPAQRQAMLRTFEADDRIQILRSMAPSFKLQGPPRPAARPQAIYASDEALLRKYGVR